MKNEVVVIAGPTASGKSQLAIDIALRCKGVILNADSMQVYKYMPIISAVPNEDDRKKVEHRLYEIYEPSVNGNVIDWLNLIVVEIKNLWKKNKIPVVVGGTGLYIDNLINGTTPIPDTNEAVRKKVAELLAQNGVQQLYKMLEDVDKETAQRLSPNDTTRVRRAYEVWLDTKTPLSEWHKKPMVKKIPEARFKVIKIVPKAEDLDARCFRRFDLMIEQGALAEVERLKKLNLDRDLPAMKALGVPELLEYCDKHCSLEEAVALAKLHTRQYAKRQRTWFKNKLQADKIINECYYGAENINLDEFYI